MGVKNTKLKFICIYIYRYTDNINKTYNFWSLLTRCETVAFTSAMDMVVITLWPCSVRCADRRGPCDSPVFTKTTWSGSCTSSTGSTRASCSNNTFLG